MRIEGMLVGWDGPVLTDVTSQLLLEGDLMKVRSDLWLMVVVVRPHRVDSNYTICNVNRSLGKTANNDTVSCSRMFSCIARKLLEYVGPILVESSRVISPNDPFAHVLLAFDRWGVRYLGRVRCARANNDG